MSYKSEKHSQRLCFIIIIIIMYRTIKSRSGHDFYMHRFHRDYYMGFPLSRLSARDSNIGPRACPLSDIGRGLIDSVITKNPCYDMFIIQILL